MLPLNVSIILVQAFSSGAPQHFRKEQQDSQVNYLYTVLKRQQSDHHFISHDLSSLHFGLVLHDNYILKTLRICILVHQQLN